MTKQEAIEEREAIGVALSVEIARYGPITEEAAALVRGRLAELNTIIEGGEK